MVCPLIKGPRLSCNAELVANTSLSFDLYDHRILHMPHEQATVIVTINHVHSGSIHMVKKIDLRTTSELMIERDNKTVVTHPVLY